MAIYLATAPVLSTPGEYVLNAGMADETKSTADHLSNEQLVQTYEIQRTLAEIKLRAWKRVALQFPDHMLPHAAQVYRLLEQGLELRGGLCGELASPDTAVSIAEQNRAMLAVEQPVKLTILADTSYGSCCADEIAAEHIEVEAIVHYGRSCLSPTSRLPVLYIPTQTDIDIDKAVDAFCEPFPTYDSKVIITADLPYTSHVPRLAEALQKLGYHNLHAAEVVHNPSSLLPNRTVPDEVEVDDTKLADWSLFHIDEPPTALLLTLSSEVQQIQIYGPSDTKGESHQARTSALLRRRYALVTSMSTVSTWGILINTLSVKNYLHMVDHVKHKIELAGKKSYLFVVGKLNAAKLANFSEIGGWVTIGCWESSLIDSKDFFRPILTPYELEIALTADESRVWTGTWRSDFESVLSRTAQENTPTHEVIGDDGETENETSDDMSAPPEFDLRSGRYVSHTRPLAQRSLKAAQGSAVKENPSQALIEVNNREMLAVNGITSPGADYLISQRSWRGLGTEFDIGAENDEVSGAPIEEGRSGMARGYNIAGSVLS